MEVAYGQMFKPLTTLFRNPRGLLEADCDVQRLYVRAGGKFPGFPIELAISGISSRILCKVHTLVYEQRTLMLRVVLFILSVAAMIVDYSVTLVFTANS